MSLKLGDKIRNQELLLKNYETVSEGRSEQQLLPAQNKSLPRTYQLLPLSQSTVQLVAQLYNQMAKAGENK